MKTYVTRSYLPAIKSYNITQLQLWMMKGFFYTSYSRGVNFPGSFIKLFEDF